MHGGTDGPSRGKPGPKSVNRSSKGSNPANNSTGTPGGSQASKPIPGPSNPGQPAAMKKALARKSTPNRGTNSPGKY